MLSRMNPSHKTSTTIPKATISLKMPITTYTTKSTSCTTSDGNRWADDPMLAMQGSVTIQRQWPIGFRNQLGRDYKGSEADTAIDHKRRSMLRGLQVKQPLLLLKSPLV